MIPNVDNIARTLTKFSLNKRCDRIAPCAFSMRALDQGYLSVREIKEGWIEFVKTAYSEYQSQYVIDNPGQDAPPNMIGYAEINIADLESAIVEDSMEIDNQTLDYEISFSVEEIPLGNNEFHAGIKVINGLKQVVVKNTEPMPDDAIVVDKVPGMMAKKKLIELSKFVPF